MRLAIAFPNTVITLGITAKNPFLKCLPPDENGQFDTVQPVTKELIEKIKEMPAVDPAGSNGFSDEYKQSFIAAFVNAGIGKKFVMTEDFIVSIEEPRAQWLMHTSRIINEEKGTTLAQAAEKAKEVIETILKDKAQEEKDGTETKRPEQNV